MGSMASSRRVWRIDPSAVPKAQLQEWRPTTSTWGPMEVVDARVQIEFARACLARAEWWKAVELAAAVALLGDEYLAEAATVLFDLHAMQPDAVNLLREALFPA